MPVSTQALFNSYFCCFAGGDIDSQVIAKLPNEIAIATKDVALEIVKQFSVSGPNYLKILFPLCEMLRRDCSDFIHGNHGDYICGMLSLCLSFYI